MFTVRKFRAYTVSTDKKKERKKMTIHKPEEYKSIKACGNYLQMYKSITTYILLISMALTLAYYVNLNDQRISDQHARSQYQVWDYKGGDWK